MYKNLCKTIDIKRKKLFLDLNEICIVYYFFCDVKTFLLYFKFEFWLIELAKLSILASSLTIKTSSVRRCFYISPLSCM